MAHKKKATGKKKSVYILYQLLYIIRKKRGKERNHRSTLSQEKSDKMSTKKKSNTQINILHLFNIYIYTYTYFLNLRMSEMKEREKKKLSPNATAKCLCLH